MKLLLVEDEKHLAEGLSHIFKREKYQVDNAYDGVTAYEMASSGIYDAIVLDLMLPKKDGIEVLKDLRKAGVATPVLILSAKKEPLDRIKGLDLGADDYLGKPFVSEELLARIRALIRRKTESLNEDIMTYGDITLNLSSYEISKGDKNVKVSLKECDILKYLLTRPKFVVTKDELIINIWGYDSDAEYNNIEVYISFLRKKLKFIGAETEITTVRGVGYRLGE